MEYIKYSRGTVFYSIAQLVVIITSFFGNIIFTRFINQSDLGIYALSYSLMVSFIKICSFGIGAGLIIYSIKSEKKGLFRKIAIFRLITVPIFIIFILSINNIFVNLYNSTLLGILIQLSCIYLILFHGFSLFRAFFLQVLLSH